MAIAYPQVELNGKPYDALATLEAAQTYLAADPNADDWRDGDDDDQARWLIGASRILLRQTYVEGTLAGPDVPEALATAAIELAGALAGGNDAANQQSNQNLLRRQKAGSVEQDFFYDSTTVALRFPLPVWELIAPLLGSSSSSIAGVVANGTCGRSWFEDQFSTGYPYGGDDGGYQYLRSYD